MGPLVALFWSAENRSAADVVQAFQRALLKDPQWIETAGGGDHRVYGLRHRRLDVRVVEPHRALFLGDVFASDGRPAGQALDLGSSPSPIELAKGALAQVWGRYLLVARTTSGAVQGVFRDPCGATEGLVWTERGVTVVATDLPQSLLEHFGPKRGLDWNAIHGLLADPVFGSLSAPLDGITTLPPGALAIADAGEFRLQQVWAPRDFADRPLEDEGSIEAELRRRVDLCVSSYAARGEGILAEVSGGLDSSVVASALRQAGAPVVGWCHHAFPDRGGDERVFAEALGRQLGIEIEQNVRTAFTLTPALIERTQFGPRPSGFGLDPQYEDDTLALAARAGAGRLFTGLGGDGLFFVSPFPGIARDLYLRRGMRGLLSKDLADLARWCRVSVWSLARRALQNARKAPVVRAPPWIVAVDAEAQQAAEHPWLDGTEDLAPAKRQHIREQVLAQVASGVSLRGRALDLVHPLLSQPIVEHCLRTPVDVMVAGGRDRALARRAFKSRLPKAILERRSKGELGPYYSRAFAAGLEIIRPYLLEGRLVEKGLLVAPVLEQTLDQAYLAQHGQLALLLRTLAVEAWVRQWEHRAGV